MLIRLNTVSYTITFTLNGLYCAALAKCKIFWNENEPSWCSTRRIL